MNKALLVLHSPVDTTVSIDEAAKIYMAARHPKSFISLDRADHLLSRRKDSEYVADIIAAWAGRYLGLQNTREERSSGTAPAREAGQVRVTEQNLKLTRRIHTVPHQLIADEPVTTGGADLGLDPYELLLAFFGACTSMTIRMYANCKALPLTNVDVTLKHARIHAQDCEQCKSDAGYVDKIEKWAGLEGDLAEEQHQRLLQIGDKCPVHKTLHNEIIFKSHLVP